MVQLLAIAEVDCLVYTFYLKEWLTNTGYNAYHSATLSFVYVHFKTEPRVSSQQEPHLKMADERFPDERFVTVIVGRILDKRSR